MELVVERGNSLHSRGVAFQTSTLTITDSNLGICSYYTRSMLLTLQLQSHYDWISIKSYE